MDNRQQTRSFEEKPKTARNKINIAIISALFLSFGLGCNFSPETTDRPATESRAQLETKKEAVNKPKRLDTYTVRGFKFSYYLVPKNLSHDELINAAQEIHGEEPDAQLILVDDESGIADYVNYAKEISRGNNEIKFPKEWAQEHIVGNVQKYLSGKWMLCEGNGYREIAELR